MATKKTATKKGATTSASTKKAATKAKAPKKSTGASATKTTTPKASAKAPKAAAKKPAIKVTDKQREFLKKIDETSEPGYQPSNKAEEKTIEALLSRKLIKRGKKDKTSGKFHYQSSSTGKNLLKQPATV